MLAGASERFTYIPEGYEGSVATLRRMAEMIVAPDPVVDDFADILAQVSDDPVQVVKTFFEWVRAKMLYTPDFNNGVVIEEIRTPGYLLHEITALGAALGDCDDYVVLYGAVFHRMGFPVTLEAVSTHPDRQLDHVYCSVMVNGQRIPLDGIVPEPFGWEVPENEVTNRLQELV